MVGQCTCMMQRQSVCAAAHVTLRLQAGLRPCTALHLTLAASGYWHDCMLLAHAVRFRSLDWSGGALVGIVDLLLHAH
jgi:hypothetical protein